MISDLFERTGYREMLEAEGFEGEGKIDNINELIAGALEYESRMNELSTPPTLPSLPQMLTYSRLAISIVVFAV
jgi:superfamily I DNA/RNA helicase